MKRRKMCIYGIVYSMKNVTTINIAGKHVFQICINVEPRKNRQKNGTVQISHIYLKCTLHEIYGTLKTFTNVKFMKQ